MLTCQATCVLVIQQMPAKLLRVAGRPARQRW
nr:MAG TPA: hypothetical protein [Caudoviricetes sp.]